jgi:hypothetical protein
MDIQIRAAWDAVSSLAKKYHGRAPDARMSAYQSACIDALSGMPSGFRDVVAFSLLCRSIQGVLDRGMIVAGVGEASSPCKSPHAAPPLPCDPESPFPSAFE